MWIARVPRNLEFVRDTFEFWISAVCCLLDGPTTDELIKQTIDGYWPVLANNSRIGFASA